MVTLQCAKLMYTYVALTCVHALLWLVWTGIPCDHITVNPVNDAIASPDLHTQFMNKYVECVDPFAFVIALYCYRLLLLATGRLATMDMNIARCLLAETFGCIAEMSCAITILMSCEDSVRIRAHRTANPRIASSTLFTSSHAIS